MRKILQVRRQPPEKLFRVVEIVSLAKAADVRTFVRYGRAWGATMTAAELERGVAEDDCA